MQETGPSSAELEAIENQPDPLERYQRDVGKAKAPKPKSSTTADRTTNGLSKSTWTKESKERPVRSESLAARESVAPRDHHIRQKPTDITIKSQSGKRNVPIVQQILEPLAPTNTKASNGSRRAKRHSIHGTQDEKALAAVRAAMGERPSTSMALRVSDDHRVSATSDDPSTVSTPRSNMTRDHRISDSTAVTSFAHTPADDRRISAAASNKATNGTSFPVRNSSRDAHARVLMAQEIARRERLHESPQLDAQPPTAEPAPAPPLYRQASRTSVHDQSRPRSRAGSIKDSVFGSLRDYIQPRPSLDRYMSREGSRGASRTRGGPSSRPESRASDRPGSSHSNASSMGGARNWIRGAANGLRSKSSWSSFQSFRGGSGDNEEERGRKTERPDLNRSLPPLPGLETYRAPKRHIAQLLAISTPSAPETDTAAPPSDAFQEQYQPEQPRLQQHSPAPRGQHPRIPFADEDAPATRSANAALSPSSTALAREEQRNGNRPSQRDTEFERRREEEIRRAVREKMLQGSERLASHRRVASDGRTLLANNKDVEGDDPERRRRERRKRRAEQEDRARKEAGRTERDPGKEVREYRWRTSDAMDTPTRRQGEATDASGMLSPSGPPKKGLKNRLSRLLGGNGAGKAVVAN